MNRMVGHFLSFKSLAILVGVASILLLASCTPSHNQSTFDPAGPVAEKQKDLFLIIFWAAVVVFVAVEGVLIYAVFRYRRKKGDQQIPAQVHGNLRLEVGWTIAPAIVLAVIAVPTIIYIFDIAETPGEGALEVTVTGHQWWWEFDYPEQDLITANEMHIPVNTQIKVNLRSDDVIHSFWIPKLAGKVDVIPRNTNKMQFTATRTGTFYGQCAEFCGVAHALMGLRVIVQEQGDFDAWVAQYKEIAARPPPTDGPEARGFQLFAGRGCLLCHKSDGPASSGVRQSLKRAFENGELRFPAPNLTNLGSRTTLAAGRLELTEDNLKKWLRDPDDVKEGNRMAELANVYIDPNTKLSEEDVSDLAAYLLSLK